MERRKRILNRVSIRRLIVTIFMVTAFTPNSFAIDKNVEYLTSQTLKSLGIAVQSVKIADGRANGGDRIMIITYIIGTSTPSSDNLGELVKVLECGYVANIQCSANLDEVSAVVGAKDGSAIAMFSVKVKDTMEYMDKTTRTISDTQKYVSKWVGLYFNRRYFNSIAGLVRQP